MRHLLAQGNREIVRRYVRSKVLIAFDYDGTLAPIAARPERARVRDRTRALLSEVACLYPCAVISGRAHQDVAARLRGVGIARVFGNHGVESSGHVPPFRFAVARFKRDVESWLPLLDAHLRGVDGIVVENKGLSVAVHFRQSRAKHRALERIRVATAALGSVRLLGGKDVVNILPRGAPHKGTALRETMAQLRCDTAIYVGDDDTDEDVFRLEEPDRVMTVRVEKNSWSRARYFLRRQVEIDALLRLLIAYRT